MQPLARRGLGFLRTRLRFQHSDWNFDSPSILEMQTIRASPPALSRSLSEVMTWLSLAACRRSTTGLYPRAASWANSVLQMSSLRLMGYRSHVRARFPGSYTKDCHETGGSEPVLLEYLRDRENLRLERPAPIGFELMGKSAGDHAGMRSKHPRRCGKGAFRIPPHAPQASPCARCCTGIPLQPKLDGAHGIENDQEDVWRARV
jgi:hypothetical protein